ncbi:MAG: MerR family transcriptional regulator [Clostridiales bacterium]|nr:MerR family transcriptional regulator [Clostridiales bacterium]MDR2749446.1 MerR family transcriptional regulator [Clostridiales bacterium]
MMEVCNCPRCGKIFTKIKAPLCPACMVEEEKGFERIKEYMEENSGCNISELSEETGVSVKKIISYIHEGRLETTKGMQGDVRCQSCNKPITIGRFCASCLLEINNSFGNLYSKKTHDSESGRQKMHITPHKLL